MKTLDENEKLNNIAYYSGPVNIRRSHRDHGSLRNSSRAGFDTPKNMDEPIEF